MSTATIEAGPLVDLARDVQRMQAEKRDLIADTRRISFDPTGAYLDVDLPDGVEAFGVNPYAHSQIATHYKVPKPFYDRLLNGVTADGKRRKALAKQPDLLANLVNGLFAREPSKRMLRLMDGNVRAFLTNKYRVRDNYELLEGAVLPALYNAPTRVEVKVATLTETRMYLKVFLPDLVVPVTPKVGDVIRVGLIFSNSEVGAGATYVYPYSDKLDCLNGMVHTEFGQRNVHIGRAVGGDGTSIDAFEFFSDATVKLDDEAYFAKVKDVISGCLRREVFEAIAADMRDLAEVGFTDIPAAVEVIAKENTFNEKEKAGFLNSIITGGDLTGWGIVNGITAMARDHEDADRQTELEILAGNLVSNRAWAPKLAAATA